MLSFFLHFHGLDQYRKEIFEVKFKERRIRNHLLLCLARYRLFVLIIGLICLLTIVAQIVFQSVFFADKSFAQSLNCNPSIDFIVKNFMINAFV